jgi:hypothetical protein
MVCLWCLLDDDANPYQKSETSNALHYTECKICFRFGLESKVCKNQAYKDRSKQKKTHYEHHRVLQHVITRCCRREIPKDKFGAIACRRCDQPHCYLCIRKHDLQCAAKASKEAKEAKEQKNKKRPSSSLTELSFRGPQSFALLTAVPAMGPHNDMALLTEGHNAHGTRASKKRKSPSLLNAESKTPAVNEQKTTEAKVTFQPEASKKHKRGTGMTIKCPAHKGVKLTVEEMRACGNCRRVGFHMKTRIT